MSGDCATRERVARVFFDGFFYPLDSIDRWNRVYGPRGFLQYQCVLPPEQCREGMREILERIGASRMGSFLAVLKVFGDHPPPGLLSFPRPGATLALDFPHRGERTLRLLEELDVVVRQAGGAIYPAKDARMSGEDFRRMYGDWSAFREFMDPCFSSSFWRRVMEGSA